MLQEITLWKSLISSCAVNWASQLINDIRHVLHLPQKAAEVEGYITRYKTLGSIHQGLPTVPANTIASGISTSLEPVTALMGVLRMYTTRGSPYFKFHLCYA